MPLCTMVWKELLLHKAWKIFYCIEFSEKSEKNNFFQREKQQKFVEHEFAMLYQKILRIYGRSNTTEGTKTYFHNKVHWNVLSIAMPFLILIILSSLGSSISVRYFLAKKKRHLCWRRQQDKKSLSCNQDQLEIKAYKLKHVWMECQFVFFKNLIPSTIIQSVNIYLRRRDNSIILINKYFQRRERIEFSSWIKNFPNDATGNTENKTLKEIHQFAKNSTLTIFFWTVKLKKRGC